MIAWRIHQGHIGKVVSATPVKLCRARASGRVFRSCTQIQKLPPAIRIVFLAMETTRRRFAAVNSLWPVVLRSRPGIIVRPASSCARTRSTLQSLYLECGRYPIPWRASIEVVTGTRPGAPPAGRLALQETHPLDRVAEQFRISPFALAFPLKSMERARIDISTRVRDQPPRCPAKGALVRNAGCFQLCQLLQPQFVAVFAILSMMRSRLPGSFRRPCPRSKLSVALHNLRDLIDFRTNSSARSSTPLHMGERETIVSTPQLPRSSRLAIITSCSRVKGYRPQRAQDTRTDHWSFFRRRGGLGPVPHLRWPAAAWCGRPSVGSAIQGGVRQLGVGTVFVKRYTFAPSGEALSISSF